MASTITFTDAIGAATLSNGKPSPGDRFSSWTPKTRPYGVHATVQSTGATAIFQYRTDYMASFELRGIPVAQVSSTRMVDIADRLIAHLLRGGSCVITTGDSDGNVYSGCRFVPGSTPDLRMTDPVLLEYTLSLEVLNGAASAMVCHYDG